MKKWLPVFVYLVLVIPMQLIIFSGCKDREPTAPIEINRPKSYGIEPKDGSLIIPVSTDIKMYFTEKMNLSTFNGRFILKDFYGNYVDGGFSSIDSVVIFQPKSPLKKSSIYFAELKGRVRDANNNSIELGNEGVFVDSASIFSTWFYSEGDYSYNGFYNVYLRDRKDGSIRTFSYLDSLVNKTSGFSAPQGIAVSQDGKYILVANTGKNEVQIINTSSFAIEKTITVASVPSSIVCYSVFAYVISEGGKAITKINLSTLSLETKFNLNFFPARLAISNDSTTLFTFDQVKRDLYIINASTGAVKKSFPAAVDKQVIGELRVNPFTGEIFIFDTKGLKIKTTDANGISLQTILTFPASSEPIDAGFTSKYILVAAGKSIYKYDAVSKSAIDTLSFLTNVKSLAPLPSEDVLYVTLATSIVIIDIETMTVLKEIDIASSGIETILPNPKKLSN
ncbi:MAG: hypothetical protein COZ80_02675 [Ignavibacteria bacterium CG_4_8_14_3_um_filter_37_9]|nr:hypothetical protein [Ignavibacteria bacterium]OIO23013.1 MAG: hypothetical protein AUJ54_02550 [Ignavibacteria bacterium CG1_02_37_35]PIP77358.1 MAG: hypothetical protein COW85_09370 [Ignavibacteria bacterium CG22_combo_CG10-13_8_21_14_all_37_15]PIS46209.1 MAG: hypothetical protein COT22_01165 [Ignavibacteria bacterium CG08_land_8_20_14_0_20_37_9]PIW99956.1 MAG: hypothetical protein COZ80_02675 [Ignavibacteria bacterium CG_4_8_14_3_um_filter_37_9]PIX94554.1 MAG: hypothetical protein COZ25_